LTVCTKFSYLESFHPTQQVEVVPSLVTDCKKLLRRNRLFWGLGIGNFEV
jgi:hypothetical protein